MWSGHPYDTPQTADREARLYTNTNRVVVTLRKLIFCEISDPEH